MKFEAGGWAAVTLLAAALFFTGLGASPLWDEDETRFASVAREMRRSGDWIVPRDNANLADKPAGLFWLIAAGFALVGESPAGARLASAACGTAVVAMTWILGCLLYSRRTAFWGAAAMCTALLVVVESRAATADAALLAVITAMLLVAARIWWRTGSFRCVALSQTTAAAIGVLAGLGILLKGLVAIVVPLLAFAVFLTWACEQESWVKRLSCALRALRVPTVLGAAAVVALPWHLAVGWSTQGAWLELFYGRHHFGRVFTVMEGHGGLPFLQIPWLFAGMFPWSVFLPLAAWRTARQSATGDAAAKLLVAWSAVWILLFSLTATQLPNYVLPAYPLLCLGVGHLLARGMESPDSMRNAWFYAAASGLAVSAAVIVAGVWFAADWLDDARLRSLSWLGVAPVAAAVALTFSIAYGQRRLGATAVLCGAVAFFAGVFLWGAPLVAATDPVPAMVAQADRAVAGRAPLGSWRYSAPGVVWHAARPVRSFPSVEEAAEFLVRGAGNSFLLIDAAALDELDRVVRGRLVILAEGRPPTRRNKVLLVALR